MKTRLLTSLITLCAVLGACSPAAPEAPAEALPSSQTQAIAGEPQLSPEFAVDPAQTPAAQQENAVVAAGNGLYLVVWMDYSDTHSPDIYGVRVRASDGARLDATPLLIATGANTQYQPAVAFDGTNFLVVWNEIRGVPTIYGARVRASDGALLDAASPRLISLTNMGSYQLPQFAPAVAFDGTNFLVAWSGYYYANGPVFTGVQAIRVRASDGMPIESSSIIVAQDGSSVRVAYTDGNYLVTWQRSQNVEAARIRASTGALLDVTPISLAATTGPEHSPAVAAQNGEFLTVWIGPDSGVWARRVRASDGVKLGTTSLSVGPSAVAAPEVTFDGQDYRVLWLATRGEARKAVTVRVPAVGEVLTEPELVLSEVPSSTQPVRGGIAAVGSGLYLATYASYDTSVSKHRCRMRLVTEGSAHVSPELAVSLATAASSQHLNTAVAAGNGVYLVVWSEVNSTSGDRPDILGVRVRATDGERLDATPLRIGTVTPSADLEPAVAFDGTNFLVVWTAIDAYPIIAGARVRASDGAVLDPSPLLISRPDSGPYSGLPQTGPSATFDGTNYLVSWTGYSYANGTVVSGVLATRVRPSDATPIEATATLLAPGGSAPHLASTNGTSLVAWTRSSNIEAVRLSASTGQVLDASPLSVAATSHREINPAVAAQNGEFLVVWISSADLQARRLRASDGVKLGAADIAVGASAQGLPDATFDGRDYRISWQGIRGGVRTLIGTRLSKQGELTEGAERWLSPMNSYAPDYRSGIAAASPGHFLVSYSQYDAAVAKVRARMRLVSDEQAPEVCDESGEPTLVLNGGSPLTLECGAGTYSDPGAQAFDACGLPLEVHAYNTGGDSSGPGPNLRYEGSYSVSYAAWDAMGRTVNALRTVVVDDRTAPTLTLLGAARMTHTCGSQWVDPGVQATDACYGDLSAQVWRTGDVNGWAVGTYTVTYSLTDSGGNSATPVTRTVDVVNCPW